MAKNNQKKSGKRASNGPSIASQSDIHQLYQKAVQKPGFEVDFMTQTFQALRGRQPMRMREDFCGTGFLARRWGLSHPERRADGVDLCGKTLAWGEAHNLAPKAEQLGGRVVLHEGDVCTTSTPAADVTCAFNFSFCVFKTRDQLRGYFEAARKNLAADGLLFLDIYGGTEAITELEEESELGDFDYIWEQETFNPLTHETVCHIHFAFPDGSKIKQAFTYQWRLWTVPELRELLLEAGFSAVKVYWERMDETDELDEDGDVIIEASGDFEEQTVVENQESWVCYVVGVV